MCRVAGAGSAGAVALGCLQAHGYMHTPSTAGGGMQEIELEKIGCSHGDVQAQGWQQEHPPQLVQATQKQQIGHFCRCCQDPDLGFSSLGLSPHSPAPSVCFPTTRQAKHFTIPASGTHLWAKLSACHW